MIVSDGILDDQKHPDSKLKDLSRLFEALSHLNKDLKRITSDPE